MNLLGTDTSVSEEEPTPVKAERTTHEFDGILYTVHTLSITDENLSKQSFASWQMITFSCVRERVRPL